MTCISHNCRQHRTTFNVITVDFGASFIEWTIGLSCYDILTHLYRVNPRNFFGGYTKLLIEHKKHINIQINNKTDSGSQQHEFYL